MKFEEIVEIISKQGTREMDKSIVEAVLLYYGSILINRYEHKKNIKNLSNNINFFTFIFARSGASKSYVIQLVEKIVGLDDYISQMETMYGIFLELGSNEKPDKEILRYIPMNPTVSVSGSKEGLFETAKAIKETGFGSLNLITDEVTDIVTSSNELLNTLKQAYDGKLQAKLIKGDKESARKYDIENIVVNLLAAGSIDYIDADTRKALNRLAVTGMYRRSLVIDSKQEVEKREEYNVSLDPVIQYFQELNKYYKDDYNDRLDVYNKTGVMSKIFDITDEAIEYIDSLDSQLILRANKDKLNQWKQYDIGSLNMIVNIAYIIAYIQMDKKVDVNHLQRAWEIFIKTRELCMDTFNEVKPYKEIYELLKIKPNLTQSDLIELSKCNCIPKQSKQFKDIMLLVQELAYRDGIRLKENKGIVTRYSLEELPKTNLNKLILSIEADGKKEKAIAFEQVEFSWEDLERVVTSYRRIEVDEFGEEIELGIDSFTLAHYESSAKTEPYGHRKAENFIQGQNMIAFDIDGTHKVEEIVEILKQYKFLLYTTKSHQTLKRNYKDSFRVLLPTKSIYYVGPEQHKEMYKNITEFFDIYSDTQAFNVSRLWFTNKDAEIMLNDGETLFDVSNFIPDTNASEILRRVREFKDSLTISTDDEAQRRINGMLKYMIATTVVGNLKNNIFKLYKFVYDLTGSKEVAERELWKFQNIVGFPERFIHQFLQSNKG
jgi:hypothetical protein